jgi:hypothetical protein
MIAPLVAGYLRRRSAVIVMLLGAILLAGFGGDSRAAFTAIVLSLVLLSWQVVPSGVNAFTCALPIRGRDLVMARAIAIVVVTVVPIATWMTLAAISGQAPATVRLSGGLLAALALGAAAAGTWIHYTIPDALPLPINEARRRVDVAAGDGEERGPTWLSVVRTALPPTYSLYCVLLVGAAAVGTAALFYCLILLSVPAMIRQRSEWLAALPVSDRRRLLLIVLPTVAASIACIEVGRLLHLPVLVRQERLSSDYRLWLIDAAVLAVLGVMVLLVAEIGGRLSRRRAGPSALFLRELATLPVAAILIADIVRRDRGAEGMTAIATRTLHDMADNSAVHAWSLLVLAVALLVTAYALLERQFRRSGTSGEGAAQSA